MELNRCSRCGSFYAAEGNVCPKCSNRDGFEFSNFISYVEENGLEESLDSISGEIGISVKNLNRFLGYKEFKDLKNGNIDNLKSNGVFIDNDPNGFTFNG